MGHSLGSLWGVTPSTGPPTQATPRGSQRLEPCRQTACLLGRGCSGGLGCGGMTLHGPKTQVLPRTWGAKQRACHPSALLYRGGADAHQGTCMHAHAQGLAGEASASRASRQQCPCLTVSPAAIPNDETLCPLTDKRGSSQGLRELLTEQNFWEFLRSPPP